MTIIFITFIICKNLELSGGCFDKIYREKHRESLRALLDKHRKHQNNTKKVANQIHAKKVHTIL